MEKKKASNGGTPFLPEEIVINILKRLPVKSLKRFQCVCKHWKDLFKTPSFIQEHLHHSTHQNSSLVVGPHGIYDGFYLLLFNFELQFREFENAPLMGSLVGLCLVGSSNGILCFEDWSKQPPTPLLWNPATREVRQVPIIFDDFKNWGCHFGFGFSPIINDYRIVRISLTPLVRKVEVYSLSTGCWRNIQFENIKDVSMCSHCVTAKGVMYWRGTKVMDTHWIHVTHVIVAFDLATEVFRVIPWHDCAAYNDKLAVHDDNLAIISYPNTIISQLYYLEGAADEKFINFEVMEEEPIGSSGKRWSLREIYSGNFDLWLYVGTIWKNQIVFINHGMPIFTEHAIEFNECLYMIDVIADECKQFDIPRPKPGSHVCVFNYVESLVPVSSNIQIE